MSNQIITTNEVPCLPVSRFNLLMETTNQKEYMFYNEKTHKKRVNGYVTFDADKDGKILKAYYGATKKAAIEKYSTFNKVEKYSKSIEEDLYKLEGKHKLELNIVGDGRSFLNFWDWAHGNDVVCEIRDEKLYYTPIDENSKSLPEKEISFNEFLTLVKESIEKRKL